jgi:hypothetical protein
MWNVGMSAGSETERMADMNSVEIAKLEHAGRSAMAWAPEVDERDNRLGLLLAATLPGLGILAVSAALLLAVL